MDGDRPITRREDDRLGFALVAEHLAGAINALPAAEGFVFGIEGKWGSGKSSLINLTTQALRASDDAAPEIVTFAPWLVGDRDDLLRSLFNGLVTAVDNIDPTAPASWTEALQNEHWKAKQKRAVGEKLAAFGNVVGHVGKLAKVAVLAGVPGAGLAETMIDAGVEATKMLGKTASVSQQKAELVDDLKLLSRRIVVFIDDLDRLEPKEANEVLRLIRAVADFPNVVYVLSYDPDVVAQTLVNAIQVVIDGTGGRYLKTGRDVVRTLNALRLHGLPVQELIDIPDMVWLQLIRIGNPNLYTWIEEYLVEAAAVANGASVSHADAKKIADRLKRILDDEGLPYERAIFELSELVPGLSARGEDHARVFNNIRGAALDDLVASKRLGSPQHYRYYFAFSQPAGALSDERVQLFIDTAETDPVKAIQSFANLHDQARPQGGTLADVLIDRLIAWGDRISEKAVPGILTVFAETLDDTVRPDLPANFGEYPIWHSAARATDLLLKRMGGDQRSKCLDTLFTKGKALGWLTEVLRSEIFTHGHYGDRQKPAEQRLLTPTEFKSALSTMLTRYRLTPAAELLRVPDLLSLLFGWFQGNGSPDEPRQWVERQISTDAGLLALLPRVRSWRARNDEVLYPLTESALRNFLDYEAAVRRVERLASSSDATKADRELAKELSTAFEAGKRL